MILDYLLDVLDFVREDRKRAVALSVILFGIIAAVSGVFGQFIVLLLIVATIVIAFFVGEFELKKFGIELVTFTAVITGFLYGPAVGAVLGLVLVIIHFILTRSLGPYVLYCIPMMAIVGLMAGYAAAGGVGWFGGDIMMVGIVLSLIYNIITAGIGSVIFGDFFQELIWSGTNFVINFLLFWKIAPIILGVLG